MMQQMALFKGYGESFAHFEEIFAVKSLEHIRNFLTSWESNKQIAHYEVVHLKTSGVS